ncbi:MAG: hypothetical protein WAQ24_01930 [Candidatus Saccharimonadales bacterium]
MNNWVLFDVNMSFAPASGVRHAASEQAVWRETRGKVIARSADQT